MKTIEAVAIFGSKAEVARNLGISRAAVTDWGDDVPPLRVYQIREILENRQKEKRAVAQS